MAKQTTKLMSGTSLGTGTTEIDPAAGGTPANAPATETPVTEPIAPVTDAPVSEAEAGQVTYPETARPTVEEPVVEAGPDGQPRSASIEPRAASPLEAATGRVLPRRAHARSDDFRLATALPAKTRVLASGAEVSAQPAPEEIGEERIFTVATRTLRNKKLYEVGAPIPLTRVEFRTKRRIGAVEEEVFEDGETAEYLEGSLGAY